MLVGIAITWWVDDVAGVRRIQLEEIERAEQEERDARTALNEYHRA
jgi:chemotaxis signal transduction protein